MSRYRIDRHGRFVVRRRWPSPWLLLVIALLTLLALAACVEPAQPEWRVTLDSLYEQAQQGRLAAQDTSWQREFHRRLAVMEGWQ